MVARKESGREKVQKNEKERLATSNSFGKIFIFFDPLDLIVR